MRLPAVLLALALLGPRALFAQAVESGQLVRPNPVGAVQEEVRRRVPPLEMQAQVGFDHRSRGTLPGAWAPVTLWITNHTEKDLWGTLTLATVDASGQPGGSKVTRPVALPAGRRVQFNSAVFVGPSDSRLDVSVATPTGESASVTEALLAAPRLMRAIVVLGEAHAEAITSNPVYPHDALAKAGHDTHTAGIPLVGLPSAERDLGSDPGRWQVLEALPETLPDRWVAYGGVNTVLITDPAIVDTLKEGQWSAVVEFVRSGGNLVIEVPDAARMQAFEKSARLLGIAPARPGKLQTVSAAAFARAFWTRDFNADLTIGTFRARAGAQTTEVQGLSALVHADEGLGHVTVIGFTLGDDAAQNDESSLATVANAVIGSNVTQPADYERHAGSGTFTRQVDYELKSEELAQIPSHRVLLAFLLAYCICIAPLNRLVFTSERRPMGAWAVLPLIVLGFLGIALNKLSIKRPEVALLREISVVQARAGESDGLARSYLSLYSPYRATYQLHYPGRGTAVQYLVHNDHRGLDRETLTYADGVDPGQLETQAQGAAANTFRVDGIPLAPRSSANLSATERVALQGTITFGHAERDTVTNGLKVPLEGGVFISSTGSQHEVPAMRPGDTVTVSPAGAARNVEELIARTGRDRKVLEQIVMQLKQTTIHPVLIAWTSSSLTDLKVFGPSEAPQQSALTFFLIHPGKGDK